MMKTKFNVYKYFRGNDLVLAINLAAGLSIFFFGVKYSYKIYQNVDELEILTFFFMFPV